MKLAHFVAISCLLAVSSSAPQRRRNQNNVNTKFFTGNNAIDSAAWGAALGAGTQYFANQVVKYILSEPLHLRSPKSQPYFRCWTPAEAATEVAPEEGTREQTQGFFFKNLQRSSFTSTLLKSSSSVISSCSSSNFQTSSFSRRRSLVTIDWV